MKQTTLGLCFQTVTEEENNILQMSENQEPWNLSLEMSLRIPNLWHIKLGLHISGRFVQGPPQKPKSPMPLYKMM